LFADASGPDPIGERIRKLGGVFGGGVTGNEIAGVESIHRLEGSLFLDIFLGDPPSGSADDSRDDPDGGTGDAIRLGLDGGIGIDASVGGVVEGNIQI